jgi:hypothetical protein
MDPGDTCPGGRWPTTRRPAVPLARSPKQDAPADGLTRRTAAPGGHIRRTWARGSRRQRDGHARADRPLPPRTDDVVRKARRQAHNTEAGVPPDAQRRQRRVAPPRRALSRWTPRGDHRQPAEREAGPVEIARAMDAGRSVILGQRGISSSAAPTAAAPRHSASNVVPHWYYYPMAQDSASRSSRELHQSFGWRQGVHRDALWRASAPSGGVRSGGAGP